jgi:hypothetical protein
MEKGTAKPKNAYKFWIVLLVIIGLIALASSFSGQEGILNIFGGVKRNKAPTDKQENMFYTKANYAISSDVIERSGFAFKNMGDQIVAVELSSGTRVDVSRITPRSARPILRFSEYAGNMYMFDGNDLYRTDITGETLRLTVIEPLDFAIMGDYIYAIKLHNDESRLFRYRLNGGYEEICFTYAIGGMWACDGKLLLERVKDDGAPYVVYDVTDQSSLDHVLPDGILDIQTDAEAIWYMMGAEDEKTLYRRPYDEQEDFEVMRGVYEDYIVGTEVLGLLTRQTDGLVVEVYHKQSGRVTQLDGKLFEADSRIDVSQTYVYVTQADGQTWYSPLEKENWKVLPV